MMKIILVFVAVLGMSYGLLNTKFQNAIQKNLVSSQTSLFAHHVQKKITKKMMHRRPKKTRPSDINRRNVNQDKCITKIEGAPADYFIPSTPEEIKAVIEAGRRFWEEGDPDEPWIPFIEEDMAVVPPANDPPSWEMIRKLRQGTRIPVVVGGPEYVDKKAKKAAARAAKMEALNTAAAEMAANPEPEAAPAEE